MKWIGWRKQKSRAVYLRPESSYNIDIICSVWMSEEEDKEVKEQDFQQKMLQFIQTSNLQLENMQQKISQLDDAGEAEYKISDDKAIVFLCKKLSGSLKHIFANLFKRAR